MFFIKAEYKKILMRLQSIPSKHTEEHIEMHLNITNNSYFSLMSQIL